MKFFKNIVLALALASLSVSCGDEKPMDCEAAITYNVYYPGETIEKTIKVDCYETARCWVYQGYSRGRGDMNYLYFSVAESKWAKKYIIEKTRQPMRILSCEIKKIGNE